MKRTALLRKTPLARKTRLKPIGKSKHARRTRDHDFMAFIRWCDCALKDVAGTTCSGGRIEADHVGERGGRPGAAPAQRRTADDTCIPMCGIGNDGNGHHWQRTNYRGYFKGWNGERMREWCDAKIRFYQNLYKNLCRLRQTPWRRKAA